MQSTTGQLRAHRQAPFLQVTVGTRLAQLQVVRGPQHGLGVARRRELTTLKGSQDQRKHDTSGEDEVAVSEVYVRVPDVSVADVVEADVDVRGPPR